MLCEMDNDQGEREKFGKEGKSSVWMQLREMNAITKSLFVCLFSPSHFVLASKQEDEESKSEGIIIIIFFKICFCCFLFGW